MADKVRTPRPQNGKTSGDDGVVTIKKYANRRASPLGASEAFRDGRAGKPSGREARSGHPAQPGTRRGNEREETR